MAHKAWQPAKINRIITKTELAKYLNVSRPTLNKILENENVDLRNVFSILDFVIKYSKR